MIPKQEEARFSPGQGTTETEPTNTERSGVVRRSVPSAGCVPSFPVGTQEGFCWIRTYRDRPTRESQQAFPLPPQFLHPA